MSTTPVSATAALSARPTTSAPTTMATTVPAALKPSRKGAAMRATPSASSKAPWAGRDMRRKAVIAPDMLLADWPVDCDVGHRDPARVVSWPDGDEDAARRAAGRAGVVRLALARGRVRPGRGGPPRDRRDTGREARADGRSRRRGRPRRAPGVRLAGRDQAGQRPRRAGPGRRRAPRAGRRRLDRRLHRRPP